MRAADDSAISSGTPADVLMDRAGRAVARAALRAAGGGYGRRGGVVCGKGSNGGDGFAAARCLTRAGMSVACFGVGRATEAAGAAGRHLKLMEAEGVSVRPLSRSSLGGCDVIVDALFGTGFRGRAEGEGRDAIEAVNASGAVVVAVDIPSGIDGATGACDGPVVGADLTVTMGAEKIGTAVSPGALRAGRVEVADIGIPVRSARAFMLEPDDVARALPVRVPDAHKRSGGSVAILAGSDAITGAAVLAARGAARMGAGYVTVGCTPAVKQALSATCPEVLMMVIGDDVLGPGGLEPFAEVLDRADAVGIGPGLGRGQPQQSLVARTLEKVTQPVVVDADGLNALAADRGPLERRSAPTILTPHPAELGRLLGVGVTEVQSDRLGAARRACDELGAVVLLKGHRTVVARPSGDAVVNPTGGPELATAGTGDVLTGAVAALAAAGLDPFEAAWAAAFVHGLAGRTARDRSSASGVLAWDVAESLPQGVRHTTPSSAAGG